MDLYLAAANNQLQITDFLIPSITIFGALIAAIVGGLIATAGNKYIFKLGTKEKYKEKFIAKKIEAYEELYQFVVNSEHVNITQTREKSKIWASKYGLYVSSEIVSAYYEFISHCEAYMKNKNSKTKPKYVKSMNNISAIIRKELYIDKIISPENISKLLNMKK